MSSQAKVLVGPRREGPAVAPTERPPASGGESLVGQTLDGRYRIDALIGEGGLGTVYRAQHLKLERAVAIKVLKAELRAVPDIRQRFAREVRMLAALSHPSIVTITDYGDAASMPYLVMELVEGQELSQLIGIIPPARALAVVRQILSSLSYAHSADVVHRDLKPANVIVRPMPDGTDHVVVLDFGLAKFVGDEGPGHDLTRSGLVVGTPAYLPPEQIGGGAKKSDARSDLYAVGLILFELLTGRRPFITDDAAEMLRAHLATTPPTLAEALPGATVSPVLEHLIAKSLAKQPSDRYASAKEMLDALAALPPRAMERPSDPREPTGKAMSSIEIEVEPATRPPPPPRRRSGASWALPVGALGIAGAFALGLLVARVIDPEAAPTDEIPGEVAALVPEPVSTAIGAIPGAAGTTADAMHDAVEGAMEGAVASASEAVDALATAELDEGLAELEGLAGDELIDGEPIEDGVAEGLGGADEAAVAETTPPVEGTAPPAGERDLVEDPTEPHGLTVPARRPAARNPWAARVPRVLVRLRTSQHRGGLSSSELRLLTRYRNEHALDVRPRLLLAHEFVRRGWLTVALDQYERALSLDFSCRGESDLLPALIRVARTAGLAARASNMIVTVYGAEGREAVDRAIARERDDEARGRLQLLRARL
jgi:eukaryotic-like serine/threonine-protein kinase